MRPGPWDGILGRHWEPAGYPALPPGLPVAVPRHTQRPGPITAGQAHGQGGYPASCMRLAASQCLDAS